jgi:amino acid transporter
MAPESNEEMLLANDVRTLHRLGYAQELARCLGAFSNFAISLSIICILAGGITSFHVGYCSVGGAAIGIGWPIVALFALIVAMAMGQIASAFPTAGGLYHWASILGGRGWGWFTAWFNLAGLVTVLAAINVGTFQFASRAFAFDVETDLWMQVAMVSAITGSQAFINHAGIRLTARLTDFSGYLIFFVALMLTSSVLIFAPDWDLHALVRFDNFGGIYGAKSVWPSASTPWLFVLGFLLPAYTITGFDASAHASEETIDAARRVPRGIVGAVLASGLAGWIMLCAFVISTPMPPFTGVLDDQVVYEVFHGLPDSFRLPLCAGILLAQYLCGLATVTSASRMAFAFARDGGLPLSSVFRHVSPTHRTPVYAIWLVAIASILFTVYTPVYVTITAVCVIFLYVSYAIPIGLGLVAYNRWWTRMGPWQVGFWFRPFALITVIGCIGLFVIGVQPPNQIALPTVIGFFAILLAAWFVLARRTFPGPPQGTLDQHRLDEIHKAEELVHQAPIVEATGDER